VAFHRPAADEKKCMRRNIWQRMARSNMKRCNWKIGLQGSGNKRQRAARSDIKPFQQSFGGGNKRQWAARSDNKGFTEWQPLNPQFAQTTGIVSPTSTVMTINKANRTMSQRS